MDVGELYIPLFTALGALAATIGAIIAGVRGMTRIEMRVKATEEYMEDLDERVKEAERKHDILNIEWTKGVSTIIERLEALKGQTEKIEFRLDEFIKSCTDRG